MVSTFWTRFSLRRASSRVCEVDKISTRIRLSGVRQPHTRQDDPPSGASVTTVSVAGFSPTSVKTLSGSSVQGLKTSMDPTVVGAAVPVAETPVPRAHPVSKAAATAVASMARTTSAVRMDLPWVGAADYPAITIGRTSKLRGSPGFVVSRPVLATPRPGLGQLSPPSPAISACSRSRPPLRSAA